VTLTSIAMIFYFRMQNFTEIGGSDAALWPKTILNGGSPPSWILAIFVFGHVTVTKFQMCNFVYQMSEVEYTGGKLIQRWRGSSRRRNVRLSYLPRSFLLLTLNDHLRNGTRYRHNNALCLRKKRANFTNLQFRQARTNFDNFYRATRMHRADNAVARCLSSACLSVRLSHAGHTSSKFFHRRVAPPFYSVSQKNRTAKINTTNLQHFTNYFRKGYLIQFSINCVKKFLNWFRTSCAVSITTVATWRNISRKTGPLGIQHFGITW